MGASTAPTETFGEDSRSLLMIRLCYRDECPDKVMSETYLHEMVWGRSGKLRKYEGGMDELYRESSYGIVSFPESAGRVVTVTADKGLLSKCDAGQFIKDAEQGAAAVGIDASAFRNVAIYPPGGIKGCWIGGVAWVGGRHSINWVPHYYAFSITAHEVGHNFGALHDATDGDDDNKIEDEYGDASGMMGGMGGCGMTAPHRLRLGWIPKSAERNYACSSQRTNIVLMSLDQRPGSKASAVSFSRAKGGKYIISYRTDAGYDSNMNDQFKRRVSVHYDLGHGHPR